jgi:hypothetical protein
VRSDRASAAAVYLLVSIAVGLAASVGGYVIGRASG